MGAHVAARAHGAVAALVYLQNESGRVSECRARYSGVQWLSGTILGDN